MNSWPIFRTLRAAIERHPGCEPYISARVLVSTGFTSPLEFQKSESHEEIKCRVWRECLAIVLNWRDQEKHLTSDLAKLKDTADKLRQRYCQRCGEKVKRLYRSMTTDLKVCGDCYCDGK